MATNQNRQVQTEICPVCSTCHDLPLCPQPTRSEERMTSHTPGPWRAGSDLIGRGSVSISAPYWEDFAGVVVRMEGDEQNHPVGDANARLIAAAPELLAIVKHLLGMPELLCECGTQTCRTTLARAAVAKAEGRS